MPPKISEYAPILSLIKLEFVIFYKHTMRMCTHVNPIPNKRINTNRREEVTQHFMCGVMRRTEWFLVKEAPPPFFFLPILRTWFESEN